MSITKRTPIIATLVLVLTLAGCDSENILGVQTKVRIGDNAPKSQNLTVKSPSNWHKVSTMDTKVALYRWKIADLIDEGKPFLAVFGTPQHCTMCVDQITRVAVMQEKYGERFAFVHVDGYKDNKVWVEWGVKGEPWTFFVDQSGKVRQVYPGQTELGLLEMNIEELLGENS